MALSVVPTVRLRSRELLEQVFVERETGVSRAGTTYSAVEVRYRLNE